MADTARASAESVTSRGLTLTSVFASRTTPSPLASRFCGQWRRIPCPDRIYSRLPSVPIQIVTRRGLPVLRPYVVNWTSRSRAAAWSTSGLNSFIRREQSSRRLCHRDEATPGDRHPDRCFARVVRTAAACRDAHFLAILTEPVARDRVPHAVSRSATAVAAHGIFAARGTRGVGRDRGRREAVCDGRLRCRRQQLAVGLGVRWCLMERRSGPADRP